ncbi:MAG: SDR family oxidoreductase [Cyclobacteriaceae bacterium]|nr:SDR family oxidoreductase [Cyclobacteriaceae bacterium]
MKTVLITGSSSGIGKAAALYFAEQGWQVAATMRNPEKETELQKLTNIKLFALDVTEEESVKQALNLVKQTLDKIDVVVNNAGFGADGVFEAMDDTFIQKQFDTNVFGLMRVTREAIKIMREQNSGIIVQIASVGGRVAFPLYSIYHGTKWAVEGFTESLQYEVKDFNIRLKLVEPGAIKTDFYGRSRAFSKPTYTHAYDSFVQKCEAVSMEAGNKGASAESVAKVIFKAANDYSFKMRYPVAYPANVLLPLKRILPERLFFWAVKQSYKI